MTNLAGTVRALFSRAGRREPKVEIFRLKEGTRPPLFALHASGGILSFAKLARHLHSEQPFYVLKGEGIDSPHHPFTDIYHLARRYAEEIMKLVPEGPCMICGRQSETVIETGQQLLSGGRALPLTIVFDNKPPKIRAHRAQQAGPLRRRAYQVRRNLTAWLSSLAELSKLPASTSGLPLWQRIRVKRFTERRGADTPKYLNFELISNYEARPYHARVVYIQSIEFKMRSKYSDYVDKWRTVADEVVFHTTSGGHASMFEKPHVQVLARLVQTECDKATSGERIET